MFSRCVHKRWLDQYRQGGTILNGVRKELKQLGNFFPLHSSATFTLFFLCYPAFLSWKHPVVKFSSWLFRKTLDLENCYQNTTGSRNRQSCERQYSESFQEFCHCSCRFYSS